MYQNSLKFLLKEALKGCVNLVLAEDAYDIIDTYISVASVTVRLVSTH